MWNQFALVLSSPQCQLEHFEYSVSSPSREAVDAMFRALSGGHSLRKLVLHDVKKFQQEHLDRLVALSANMPGLTTLHFSQMFVEDDFDIRALGGARVRARMMRINLCCPGRCWENEETQQAILSFAQQNKTLGQLQVSGIQHANEDIIVEMDLNFCAGELQGSMDAIPLGLWPILLARANSLGELYKDTLWSYFREPLPTKDSHRVDHRAPTTIYGLLQKFLPDLLAQQTKVGN